MPRHRIVLVGLLALAAACSSGRPAGPAPHPTTAAPTQRGTSTVSAGATVWLCRPGLPDDPCAVDLSTTVVAADGSRTVQHVAPAADPPIDCFYVYPTVSRDKGLNSDLTVDPEERVVAALQAARFSTVCRVWAPMYPQLTGTALSGGAGRITAAATVTAYAGVQRAWEDYLAHDNGGRGVVLIGHSQGAVLLDALVRRVIDGDAAQRRLLVSALLLGGNVKVPDGRTVGGDFQHVPACTSATQTGCVVAYSTFEGPPPANAFFGRTDTSIAAVLGVERGTATGQQVLCTNPAALSGGAAPLDSDLPTTGTFGLLGAVAGLPAAATPWISYPGRYTARCEHRDGASWLDVTAARDHRPRLRPYLPPRWGLHIYDVSIALGNLVALVSRQSRAYGH